MTDQQLIASLKNDYQVKLLKADKDIDVLYARMGEWRAVIALLDTLQDRAKARTADEQSKADQTTNELGK